MSYENKLNQFCKVCANADVVNCQVCYYDGQAKPSNYEYDPAAENMNDVIKINATAGQIEKAAAAFNENKVLTKDQQEILDKIVFTELLKHGPKPSYKLTQHEGKSPLYELGEATREKLMRDRFDSVRYGLQHFSLHEELTPIQAVIKQNIDEGEMAFMKTEEGLDLILGKLKHLVENQRNEKEAAQRSSEAFKRVAEKAPKIREQAKLWKMRYLEVKEQKEQYADIIKKLDQRLDNEMEKTYPLKVEIERLKTRIENNEDTEKMYLANEKRAQAETELRYTKQQLEDARKEIEQLQNELIMATKGHNCSQNQRIEYREEPVIAGTNWGAHITHKVNVPVRIYCDVCNATLWEEGQENE